MKKLLMTFVGVCAMMLAAVAGDEEVTVKVSVAGDNNSALKKQCEVQGKKAGVKKYLTKMGNDKITEKVIDEAMSSYAKFIEDIEADEQEYEDGEMTCSYTVTIKQEEIGKWLQGEGIDLCDNLLNFFQSKTMLLQNPKSPVHQLIIIRLITGSFLQLRDAAGLCKCDPDLRHQNALYIKTSDIHDRILLCENIFICKYSLPLYLTKIS